MILHDLNKGWVNDCTLLSFIFTLRKPSSPNLLRPLTVESKQSTCSLLSHANELTLHFNVFQWPLHVCMIYSVASSLECKCRPFQLLWRPVTDGHTKPDSPQLVRLQEHTTDPQSDSETTCPRMQVQLRRRYSVILAFEDDSRSRSIIMLLNVHCYALIIPTISARNCSMLQVLTLWG